MNIKHIILLFITLAATTSGPITANSLNNMLAKDNEKTETVSQEKKANIDSTHKNNQIPENTEKKDGHTATSTKSLKKEPKKNTGIIKKAIVLSAFVVGCIALWKLCNASYWNNLQEPAANNEEQLPVNNAEYPRAADERQRAADEELRLVIANIDLNRLTDIDLDGINHALARGAGGAYVNDIAVNYMANDQTALLRAAATGHEAIVNLLIENGANIHAVDGNGNTALITAIRANNREIVNLLIENDANIHAVDGNGNTALITAIRVNNREIVNLLIENEADIHAAGRGGLTPLMHAIIHSHEAIVNLLIENGADIHAAGRDGLTPLIHAIIRCREAVVNQLIENGANIHAADRDGKTPLMYAAMNGGDFIRDPDGAILNRLIRAQGNVNATDTIGKTALIHAVENENIDTIQKIQILLNNGADVTLTNNRGETALDIARQNNTNAVIPILLNWVPMGG